MSFENPPNGVRPAVNPLGGSYHLRPNGVDVSSSRAAISESKDRTVSESIRLQSNAIAAAGFTTSEIISAPNDERPSAAPVVGSNQCQPNGVEVLHSRSIIYEPPQRSGSGSNSAQPSRMDIPANNTTLSRTQSVCERKK